MSNNYSEYQKKGRSQGDSRYNKRPQGDPYSNRDSRNSDRKYPDNSNSYKGYNSGSYNDNYQSKGTRPYNPNSYKPKPHYPRNTYEEQHDANQYRRKVTRYTKQDLLEGFDNSSSMPNLQDLINGFETIFVYDRQDPVNEEEFKLDPNEAFVPPRTSEPVPKKEEISSDNKFQLYDLSSQTYDPIAALKMQRQNKKEEDGGQDDDFDRYDEGKNNYSEEYREEYGDGDNFSDIDAKFEQKLRSNQYQVTEDVFDELLGGTKKEFDLRELENDQRPDWEDEKVSTTIVEKDKDFFNQNPQHDKRFIKPTSNQNSKQMAFEENKQEPLSMQAQLLNFQKQILKNQTEQQPVVQQPVQQKSQPLLLQNQPAYQNPITTQNLLAQLQINPNAQQNQPQPQPQPQQKKNDSNVDFFKLTFESDLRNEEEFDSRQDEIFSAAFSQFSSSGGYTDSYENDIDSFFKSLSSGAPTTFKTSSLLSKNLTQEVKPTVNEPQKTTPAPETTQNQQTPQTKREPPKENSTTNILGGPKKRPMPMYPSFVFRYYSGDYDQQNWYYIDVDEKKNGPFSGKSMDQWYADGTLPLELKVTIGENNQFKSIKEIADYIVAKTINGDGPPPEKKPKPQNEMINKLMEQLGGKDVQSGGDHPPLKAKTLDEIEVPVNYEKWAPPMIKAEKKKDDKNHNDRHKNYNNYRHNNEQGHNNYKKNYQNQNNRQNQNYNQNYHNNQGGNFNNMNLRPQNLINQNMMNQNQPLIQNNLNVSSDPTLQIKGLLGMVKPEIKAQQQQQTQIQVNQVPKIEIADFPSLGETYMNN